jgi:glycogen synthase
VARVLFVSSLWPPDVLGGAEIYAERLARELGARGDEIAVVTLGVDAPAVVAQVPPRPYRLSEFASQPRRRRAAYHLADLFRPDAARILRGAIAEFRPDVVHSHAVQGMSVSVLVAPSRLGVAHVHTLHDLWLLCQRSTMVRRDGEGCATRCASCRAISAARSGLARRGFPHVVVAPSEALAREHRAFAPARDRLRVVRHPVEPAERAARDGSGSRFGFLGQLVAIKGVTTLLTAFGDGGSGTLTLAGDGPLRAQVEAAASASERIEYRGWLDDAGRDRFFAEIDCLVVPSEWREPAPLVINEATARGVPVIGSSTGGIPELVPEPCRELLFPPGDVVALGRSLDRFRQDPERYRDFRPPAWGWDDHVAAVRRAYEDARRAAS